MLSREYNDIINYQIELGKLSGIPEDILIKDCSHAPKWHSCSIIEHIRWCTGLASLLFKQGLSSEQLIRIAVYHDIGKVSAPIFTDEGPIYHGHAKNGALFLRDNHLADEYTINLVKRHGQHQKVLYMPCEDRMLVLLDLCDEYSKWSLHRFPPSGSKEQIAARHNVNNRAVKAGIQLRVLYTLQLYADIVAKEEHIIFDREVKPYVAD